jgi:cysteine desulfurase
MTRLILAPKANKIPGANLTKYFDANATTEMLPEVMKAFLQWGAKGPLNASSAHSKGALARSLIEHARDTICDTLGADDPENIVFVSGGTEANNIVINGMARLGARMVVSAVEHASVMEPVSAIAAVSIVPVGGGGIVDLANLQQTLFRCNDGSPVLVCIQAANSETGVVQPLEQIGAICRAAPGEVYLHVDAAQAFGRIRLATDGIDSIAFSGHKLHGPQGTGFLWMSDRLANILPRTVLGGGQERGFRSGTQNIPGIAGLQAAVSARFADFDAQVALLRQLRDRFEEQLVKAIPNASIVCAGSDRIGNTANVQFPGADAQAMLAALDAVGIYCSTGSACSAMKPSASRVLRAIGMSEKEALNCLRFSFSILNSLEEIDEAIPLVAKAARERRLGQ